VTGEPRSPQPALRLQVDADLFEWQRFGGMSRSEAEILDRLVSRHRVEMQLLHRRPLKAFARRDDVQYLRLPFRRRRRAATAFGELVGRRRAAAFRPHLYHPTFTTEEALAVRGRGVPMVVTVYDLAYERLTPLHGDRHAEFVDLRARFVAAADHVVCISEFTRRELLALTGYPEERTSVVHLGVDMAAPDPAALPPALRGAGGYILYLGAFWPHKNVERLLRAYAGWRGRKSFRLAMAGGDQRWTPDLAALVASLGLEGSLLRLGALDDRQLAATLEGAACLAYPSLYEGFGIPLLEAMACGTLVVAARAASLPEIGGEHAIYVDPEDESSIVEGLDRACEMSSDERRRRIDDARRWAAGFTWDRAADETAAIYRRVAGA
jgi:glycosyltransferase involved in cell wall biosynthesis